MNFDKEFKEAIIRLPSREKNKLIFRLLKYDLDLANRLYFELISGDSKEDRRKQAKKAVTNNINAVKEHIRYDNPRIMLIYMRETSEIINEHIKITKDKYGEIELQIFMVKEFLTLYNDNFKDYPAEKSHKLNVYFVSRMFKILILLKKMHEDLMIDFADDLETIGHLFSDNPTLMAVATYSNLDINWLIDNEIPDDIVEINREM
ncbi:MAG: hypothetical protein LBN27_07685 [Prevotellaceae bacterium]|jgi:hypothetical protein|nr:hypothetical protein [Prevotellaceae bacterium]